mmetsp:Transcript_83860/g.166423  ORF Transcript_83860/g.166423 Transcript_83860/m.166423 type:complete len:278 (+) Transcript_83860:73-906(+)
MADPVEERGQSDVKTEPEPLSPPVKQCPVAEVGDDGIPNAERLAQYTEQWLSALREHKATAVAAASQLRDASPPHAGQAQGGSSPSTSSPIGNAAPATPDTQASNTGQRVGGSSQAQRDGLSTLGIKDCCKVSSFLKRFDQNENGESDEIVGHSRSPREQGQETAGRFRVQVPRQYPGVQFRKSKCLNDRYLRYAKLGTVVSGVVEDNGEWLRIKDNVFLPMKVNGMDILERLGDVAPGNAKPQNNSGGSFWFAACGQGSLGDEEEVLNDMDGSNER